MPVPASAILSNGRRLFRPAISRCRWGCALFLAAAREGILREPKATFSCPVPWRNPRHLSRNGKSKRAISMGYALLTAGIVVLITGLLLMRIEGLFDLKHPVSRLTVYWLHVLVPVAAGWLYWLHRLAGPKIKWRIGITYGVVV